MKHTCSTPECGEPSYCRGMCRACYQFDYYHLGQRHGQHYWVKYEKKQRRLLSRARVRIARRRRAA